MFVQHVVLNPNHFLFECLALDGWLDGRARFCQQCHFHALAA